MIGTDTRSTDLIFSDQNIQLKTFVSDSTLRHTTSTVPGCKNRRASDEGRG